jgi:uncharacterized phage protein (TIGR02220 family)
MNIRVNRKSYTTLSNYPITDKNLSGISLGIFCYIMSKPDGWKAHKNEIYKRFQGASITTSKNAIDQAFKELVASGYVEIKPMITINDKGQKMFNGKEYVFNEEPNIKNLPNSEDFGTSEISDIGNLGTSEILPHIVSTDLKVNTNNKLNTDFNNNKESSFVEKIEESVEDVKYYFELTQILNLLTEYTKVNYKIPTSKSVLLRYGAYKLVKERLKDGATLEDCLKVIETKNKEWKGTEFFKYMTVDTLFNKTKFDKYLMQTQIQKENNLSHTQKPLIDDKGNYADTDAGREQFILNIRERAAKTFRK